MGFSVGEHISVRWSSNISGELGSGDILNISKLKVGRHNITVKIADRAGASASRSFEVTIEERPSIYQPPTVNMLVIGGSVVASVMIVTILALISFLIYSRAKEKSVLDNMNRKLIFEVVKLKPGVHFMALSEELGLAIGVLSHHLNILEKNQLVKSMQDGKFRRFYLYDEKIEFKLTLTSIQQTIIYIVKQDPGITQSGISEKMGKNKMVINYHIKILKDVGLLAVERNGRETNCFLTIAALNLS
jgi:predicted transcriptional regulator